LIEKVEKKKNQGGGKGGVGRVNKVQISHDSMVYGQRGGGIGQREQKKLGRKEKVEE